MDILPAKISYRKGRFREAELAIIDVYKESLL